MLAQSSGQEPRKPEILAIENTQHGVAETDSAG